MKNIGNGINSRRMFMGRLIEIELGNYFLKLQVFILRLCLISFEMILMDFRYF